MIRFVCSSVLLLAIAVPLRALADPVDDGTAAPSGLTPTTMTLAQLRHHRQAVAAAHTNAPSLAHWTIVHAGDTGTIDEAYRGDDYRVDSTLHGMHTAYGSFGGRTWDQDENGEVVYEHDLHQRTGLDRRAESQLTSSAAAIIGEVQQPQRAYVVRLSPPGGRLEYVFYDASTYAIVRREEAEDGTRVVTTYDDFKSAGDATMAWHIRRYVTNTDDTTDEQLVSYDRTSPVADSALAIPASTSPLHFTSGQTLPVTVLSDRVIVRVRINGRPVNLQLDSGADTILIDRSVLDALRIPVFGDHQAMVAGRFRLGHAVVPKIELGTAELDKAYVGAAPFADVATDHTVVAGLLGFDFIAGSVLKIDYVNSTLTLFDPSTFTAPAGAIVQSIDAEDRVPVLAATIGGIAAPHFIMDTGADRSTLFSSYVKAHPQNTRDMGLGTQQRESYPFEQTFMGVGGEINYRPLELGPFSVAGVTFPTWLFEATYNAASFEDEDFDGLIGQDLLRYFDVYIDYAHEKVYFVPNQRYRDRYAVVLAPNIRAIG
jgi:hypothetical protein